MESPTYFDSPVRTCTTTVSQGTYNYVAKRFGLGAIHKLKANIRRLLVVEFSS